MLSRFLPILTLIFIDQIGRNSCFSLTTESTVFPPNSHSNCYNVSTFASKDGCQPPHYLLNFIYLLNPFVNLDEHWALLQQIFTPCTQVEHPSIGGKTGLSCAWTLDAINNRARFHVDVDNDDGKGIPFNNLLKVKASEVTFAFFEWTPSALPSESLNYFLKDALRSSNFTRGYYQPVFYIFTNADTNTVKFSKKQEKQEDNSNGAKNKMNLEYLSTDYIDFWRNLADMGAEINEFLMPTRFIFTKKHQLNEVARSALDNLQQHSNGFFLYEVGDLLDDPTIGIRYGLCSPQTEPTTPIIPIKSRFPTWAIIYFVAGGVFIIIQLLGCICCFKKTTMYEFSTAYLERLCHGKQLNEDEDRSAYRLTSIPVGRKNSAMSAQWEIEESLLTITNEKLGSGAYSVVMKGILRGAPPVTKIFPTAQLLSNFSTEETPVAVKMCHAHFGPDERGDFLQEISFMKSLEFHPHLLSMLGCSVDPRRPLIVTELCELGDLLRLVREIKIEMKGGDDEEEAGYEIVSKFLQFEDLLPIAWQVADGLSYLTSKQIIHRDIAARNVLITKAKMAKLSDFGLCRFSDALFYTTRGGKLPIKWMAPESIEFALFSPQTDVWSFGVLLWEMYSLGKTPFSSIQPEHILSHLKEGQRLEIPEYTPPLIYQMMKKCWEEEHSKRPPVIEIKKLLYEIMEASAEHYGYLQFCREYHRLLHTPNASLPDSEHLPAIVSDTQD